MTAEQGLCDSIPESLMRGTTYLCACSHGTTLVFVWMRVLEAESLLWSVFLQVGELLAVYGSTTLPESDTKSKVSHQNLINLITFFQTYMYTNVASALRQTPQTSSLQCELASRALLTCFILPPDGTTVALKHITTGKDLGISSINNEWSELIIHFDKVSYTLHLLVPKSFVNDWNKSSLCHFHLSLCDDAAFMHLLSNELYGIFILHSALYQSQRH